MKQFTIGSIVGLAVGGSIAATSLDDKADPCIAWKLDTVALEAAIFVLSHSDHDRFQNVLDNAGVAMGRILGANEKYRWESEALPRSERVAFDKARERVIEEIHQVVEEMIRDREQRERSVERSAVLDS
jgi:hypothetical protein